MNFVLNSLLTGRPKLAARCFRVHRRLRAGRNDDHPLRLHLGCGNKRLDGFVNIDMNLSAATDYVCNIASLPCPPNSVERIELYHVIEHIPEPIVEKVVKHWHDILIPGGTIVLECPDLDADVREYLEGNTERLYSIFGRFRFPGDAHHWGYTEDSLADLLRRCGFTQTEAGTPQDYHAAIEPCIRVQGTKAG